MAQLKYAEYIKKLDFHDYGPGSYRQGVTMDSKFLGIDAQIEFGSFWSAGLMNMKTGMHKHDFDQFMFFFGADTNDMGELGAEIELILGEEKHLITTSTAVYAPKGFPHFPANIVRMNKRFLFLTISVAAQYSEIPVPDENPLQKPHVWIFTSKYRDRIVQPPFVRKGAWSYGPTNADDSGGHLGVVQSNIFDTMILCESLKKAPYRFGPEPEKPHAHTQPEFLVFMGADTADLSKLGGEVEIFLGKEMERHVITSPSAVLVPSGLPHCPVTVTRVDKPFILCDCRPYGTGRVSARSPG